MSDAWLPIGHPLAPRSHAGPVVASGEDWQVVAVSEGGRALLADDRLARHWCEAGLLAPADTIALRFGSRDLVVVQGGASHVLSPLGQCRSPGSMSEALAFATALRESRSRAGGLSFQDGLYVERLSRILPVREGEGADDALVLGMWLTGGLRIPAVPVAGLAGILTWLGPDALQSVAAAAGLAVLDRAPAIPQPPAATPDGTAATVPEGRFRLPGRPLLEAFFNDHVVDIVQNREHYRAMGIGNPGAIILEGPPGCGKTFAAEQLVAFLGWPSFTVEAATVASPYIHETSRKVAEIFRNAIACASSVVLIDEMEAFLPERDAGLGGQHRVEETAEFLRRIPEAVSAGVLVIGMTNRIDMIDHAIRRRGRFDHIIHVDHAGAAEVRELLEQMLASVPTAGDIDLDQLAGALAGRPLSDVAYVMREGARLAAKARLPALDMASLRRALESTPDRADDGRRRIGFL